MRKPLPILVLALAAAASAQTFTLTPVDVRGYQTSYYGSEYIGRLATGLRSDPGTRSGWRAEFALLDAPPGWRVASATLTARVATLATAYRTDVFQGIYVDAYRGAGTVPASLPMGANPMSVVRNASAQPESWVRLRVAAAFQAPLGRYVGFDFRGSGPSNAVFDWELPTLTVTYGPALTIPVRVEIYPGDVTTAPLWVELRRPGTLETVSSLIVYPRADGTIEVGAVPGVYDVSIRAIGFNDGDPTPWVATRWLRRTLRNVRVAGRPVTLPAVTLITGDVNRDNRVDAADRALVVANLGKTLGKRGTNANCDLDGNGAIDATDLAIVTARIGAVGDL